MSGILELQAKGSKRKGEDDSHQHDCAQLDKLVVRFNQCPGNFRVSFLHLITLLGKIAIFRLGRLPLGKKLRSQREYNIPTHKAATSTAEVACLVGTQKQNYRSTIQSVSRPVWYRAQIKASTARVDKRLCPTHLCSSCLTQWHVLLTAKRIPLSRLRGKMTRFLVTPLKTTKQKK